MNSIFFLHVRGQQICVAEAAEGDEGGGGGGNFIVIVPGANYLLSPEDVATAIDSHKRAKVVLVSSSAECQGQEGVRAARGKISRCSWTKVVSSTGGVELV